MCSATKFEILLVHNRALRLCAVRTCLDRQVLRAMLSRWSHIACNAERSATITHTPMTILATSPRLGAIGPLHTEGLRGASKYSAAQGKNKTKRGAKPRRKRTRRRLKGAQPNAPKIASKLQVESAESWSNRQDASANLLIQGNRKPLAP